ncbi:PTR36-like protein [Mya arenaria]|uniref:PTR36-like protein n=1 Tax=Mya arenaria TaxID=6604 RepID=A0ABY7DWP4_MYAAR|nr:PTR36-like protein [Mya arenaria]
MAEEKDKSDIAENVSFPRKQSAAWVAMKKVKTTLSLTNKGATPVNWKCVFLVFISLFSSSFNITFLFPFLPEMILEEEKGYYAGIVASAFYFWGWLSDKKGRKPIILITVILNGVSSLAFGFTTTLWFAFVTRFISGLVNDNTNQAVGMSIISVAWGSGIIVGPAVGGYLANPCKSYPDVFPSEGFFYKFPYFIPGFAAFIICLIPFLLDVFLLPETLNLKQFEVIVAVSLYSLFSFSVIGVEEIFTVWAATDVLLDGLGFEPNEIGAALGASSFPLLFLQLFTLLVCTLILLAVTQAMPCLHLLSSNPVSLWTLLILLSCVQKLMVSCVFSCTGLLINNSVQPHLAGTVNGLAMTVTAMTRSIAPLFGGSVYTWIVSYASQNIGPPFDISFVFFLFGLIYFIVCLVGVTIPNSLNEQKK